MQWSDWMWYKIMTSAMIGAGGCGDSPAPFHGLFELLEANSRELVAMPLNVTLVGLAELHAFSETSMDWSINLISDHNFIILVNQLIITKQTKKQRKRNNLKKKQGQGWIATNEWPLLVSVIICPPFLNDLTAYQRKLLP